jgi:hypothetical protein
MDKLKHHEIDYGAVRKNFYTESEEVSGMDPELVKMIR